MFSPFRAEAYCGLGPEQVQIPGSPEHLLGIGG